MTPAINLAKKHKITFTLHQYEHDPQSASYGLEAVEKLGLAPERVFKTLVAKLDSGDLVVAVIPVAERLNLKLLAKAAKVKKAHMAEPAEVERATGYVLGGVSPLGQKKRLNTFVHNTAETLGTVHVSAGRRGLEIELAPQDLLQLTAGKFVSLC